MSAPRGRRVPLVDNVCLSLFSSVESRQFNLKPEILRLFRHYGHQDDLHQDLSKTINSMKTVYSPGGKSHSLYSINLALVISARLVGIGREATFISLNLRQPPRNDHHSTSIKVLSSHLANSHYEDIFTSAPLVSQFEAHTRRVLRTALSTFTASTTTSLIFSPKRPPSNLAVQFHPQLQIACSTVTRSSSLCQ